MFGKLYFFLFIDLLSTLFPIYLGSFHVIIIFPSLVIAYLS